MAQKRTFPKTKTKEKKNLPGLYPLRLVSAHRSGAFPCGWVFLKQGVGADNVMVDNIDIAINNVNI